MTANNHTPTLYSICASISNSTLHSDGGLQYISLSPPISEDKVIRILNSHDALVGALKRMIRSADWNCNIDKAYYGAQKALKDAEE